MTVTTAIVPDKRRALQMSKTKEKKTFNICIRVTYQRQSRYFPTGTVLSEQDFEKLSSQNLGEKRRETRENLEKQQERAKRIIENLNNFSFRAFGEQFSAFRPGRPRRPAKAPIAGEPDVSGYK